MRIIFITLLTIVLGAGAVLAQAGAPPPAASSPASPKAAAPASPGSPAKTPTTPSTRDDKKTEKARAKENIAECMRLWDAATHMSKQQWARTCERIQTRLENLRIENMDMMGTSLRKKKG
jgi:hypothetical protein